MRYSDLTLKKFIEKAASQQCPVKVHVSNQEQGGEEHWVMTGKLGMLMHWWPFSKRRTVVYEDGTKYNLSIEQIVKILASKPKLPTVLCGECGSAMVLRNSRHGKFYGCTTFPKCRGTHGCHPDGLPLGVPANQETKLARIAAHDVFDAFWKRKKMPRNHAYKWLAEQLRISTKECHIGRFTKEQCELVMKVCQDASLLPGTAEKSDNVAEIPVFQTKQFFRVIAVVLFVVLIASTLVILWKP